MLILHERGPNETRASHGTSGWPGNGWPRHSGEAGGCPALAATANSPTGSWGTAINVPGTSAAMDSADVADVSCAPGGECMAVGDGDRQYRGCFRHHREERRLGPDDPDSGRREPRSVRRGRSPRCPARPPGTAWPSGRPGRWVVLAGDQGPLGEGDLPPRPEEPALVGRPAFAARLVLVAGQLRGRGRVLRRRAHTHHHGRRFRRERDGLQQAGSPRTVVAGVPSTANAIPESPRFPAHRPATASLGGAIISEDTSTGRSAPELAAGDLRSARSLLARDLSWPGLRWPRRGASRPGRRLAVAPFVASEVGGSWQEAEQPTLPQRTVPRAWQWSRPPRARRETKTDASWRASMPRATRPRPQAVPSCSARRALLGRRRPRIPPWASSHSPARPPGTARWRVRMRTTSPRWPGRSTGHWGSTTELPGRRRACPTRGRGPARRMADGLACPSAANCSVVGTYSIGKASRRRHRGVRRG